MDDLGTILNDGDPVAEVETEVVTETTETTEVKADETETTETVESTTEATTAPEADPEPTTVPLKALHAERGKRQALEKQVQEMQAQQPKTPAPDIFENQEAYTKYITQQMDDRLFNERANMSEHFARRDTPDLDSKMETYQALLLENPALRDQVSQSPMPWQEMVSIVDKHEKMEKMENIDEWEASKTAELEVSIRAKIEAEMQGKADASKATRDSIPTSLVGESSKGGIGKTPAPGPSSLSTIFKD